MKNVTLSVLLFMVTYLPNVLTGQEVVFPTPGMAYGELFQDFTTYRPFSIYYEKDTFICSQKFAVFAATWGNRPTYFLSYEEGKMYNHQLTGVDSCTKELIFDFTLEVGDTFPSTYPQLVVDSVGKIELEDGIERKHLFLRWGSYFKEEWIEGIGTLTYGLFDVKGNDDVVQENLLICVKDSNGVLYENPTPPFEDENICDVLTCVYPILDFELEQNNNSIKLTNQSKRIVNWQWDFGNNRYSNAFHKQYSYTSPGCYEVCLTSWVDCWSDTLRKCEWIQVAYDSPWEILDWSPRLYSIKGFHFVNDKIGWLITYDQLFHTRDGGKHWEESELTSNTSTYWRSLNDIDFINEQEGILFAGFANCNTYSCRGTVLITNDGGVTWEDKITEERAYHSGGAILDNGLAWAISSGSFLFKTLNGGETWEKYRFPNVAMRKIFPIDKDTLMGIAYDRNYSDFDKSEYFFAKTTNGLSWTFTPFGERAFYDLDFINAQEGWLCGRDGWLLHTQNGGQTWEWSSLGSGIHLYSIDFLDADNGWVTGGAGRIFHTKDGGETWELEHCGINERVTGLQMLSDTLGYANAGKRIIKYNPRRPRGHAVNLTLPVVNHPQIEIFPNPFNDQTNIRVPFILGDKVTLRIFDAFGRKVREQHFESISFVLEKADLPAGVYYIQAINNKGEMATAKVIMQGS